MNLRAHQGKPMQGESISVHSTLAFIASKNTSTTHERLGLGNGVSSYLRFSIEKQPNVVRALLRQWCTNVRSFKVEPMKEVARMILNHFDAVMTWANQRVPRNHQQPLPGC